MNKNSLNQVILIGRLGAAPEQKVTASGTVIANISVATSTTKKTEFSNEWTEETEWHRCVGFGKTAEYICKYGNKGRMCNIIGRLQTRKWTDAKGTDHYSTEIIVEQFQYLDRNDQQPYNPEQNSAQSNRGVTDVSQSKNRYFICPTDDTDGFMPNNEEEIPF